MRGPWGVAMLALFAALESSVFPAPTEPALIALVLARRDGAWRYVAVASLASLVGALAAYALGDLVFESVARPILVRFDAIRHAETVVSFYRDNAFLALATSAYTPIPYMLYTMMAGAADLPLATFVPGAVIGRLLKFLPLALGAYFAGPTVYRLIQRFGWWLVAGVTALLVVAIIVAR